MGRSFLLLLGVPAVAGCLGSHIMYKEEQRPEGTYESLIHVPPRPPSMDPRIIEQDTNTLKKLYESNTKKDVT